MSHRLREVLPAGGAMEVAGIVLLNLVFPPPGRQDTWQWVVGLMGFRVAAALLRTKRAGSHVGMTPPAVGWQDVGGLVKEGL